MNRRPTPPSVYSTYPLLPLPRAVGSVLKDEGLTVKGGAGLNENGVAGEDANGVVPNRTDDDEDEEEEEEEEEEEKEEEEEEKRRAEKRREEKRKTKRKTKRKRKRKRKRSWCFLLPSFYAACWEGRRGDGANGGLWARHD